MGGERGSKNINMVSKLVKCLDHGGGGSTLSSSRRTGKRKSKKNSLHVRGSVGSPTIARHGLIEVNIYGGTLLLLQGLLVGGERGSKNISKSIGL